MWEELETFVVNRKDSKKDNKVLEFNAEQLGKWIWVNNNELDI
jgi:hypothetical protein